MRLTCPNCGAQYEIPDDVLPEAGRDVQCSNCGDTWFQQHPDAMTEVEDDGAHGFATEADPDPDAASAPDVQENAPTVQPDPQDDSEDVTAAVGAVAATVALDKTQDKTRRRLDPEVSSVLRQEAEHEARVRAREAGSLETQTDLGLDDGDVEADRRSRESRTRMARLRGEAAPVDSGPAPDHEDIDPTSRRGLLPDIEEISSSLRSDEGRPDPDDMEETYPEAPDRSQGGGFRRGFLLVVALAIVLMLLYIFAPQIARAVPALGDVMGEYVEVVNGARIWLNERIASLMLWLDGMASSGSDVDAS